MRVCCASKASVLPTGSALDGSPPSTASGSSRAPKLASTAPATVALGHCGPSVELRQWLGEVGPDIRGGGGRRQTMLPD